jgi:hypothetical protein
MTEYGVLSIHFRRGVVTFPLILSYKLFSINHDTTTALKIFLKLFKTKGLQHWLKRDSRQLEVNFILTGLVISSVEELSLIIGFVQP